MIEISVVLCDVDGLLIDAREWRYEVLKDERVMARDFDRQVAELQVRAALINRFTQLCSPITVAMP